MVSCHGRQLDLPRGDDYDPRSEPRHDRRAPPGPTRIPTSVKIHEYQAKAIFRQFGVPVPRGEVAFAADEVYDIAKRLGGGTVVVKAQIHAGGRGKGGGVKLAKNPDEAVADRAGRCSGMTLVTHQTGPEGRVVSRVLDRGGHADRARAVLQHPARPRRDAPDHHGERRRRHGHRGSRREDAGEDHPRARRSGDRPHPVPDPQDRVRARARGRAGPEGVEADDGRLRRVRRHRRLARRDQPAHRDRRRRPDRARRQDELRRQRALPAHRPPRVPRPRRRGSARDRSVASSR